MEQQTKDLNRKAIKDFCRLIFEINQCHWNIENPKPNQKNNQKEWEEKLDKIEEEFVNCLKHMIK